MLDLSRSGALYCKIYVLQFVSMNISISISTVFAVKALTDCVDSLLFPIAPH